MKKMKDYHDLCYDVLLLADAFEKSKNSSLENYKLCPSHCLGRARALTWNSILSLKKL